MLQSDPADPRSSKMASEQARTTSELLLNQLKVRKWVCEARRNPERKPELPIRASLTEQFLIAALLCDRHSYW